MTKQLSIGDLSPLNVSGAHNVLYAIPAAEREDGRPHAFLWSNVGAGCPERAWHGRWLAVMTIPADATATSVQRLVERHERVILGWLAAYQGTEWDGNNLVGKWSRDLDDVVEHVTDSWSEELVCWCDPRDAYSGVRRSDLLRLVREALADAHEPEARRQAFAKLVEREVDSCEDAQLAVREDELREYLLDVVRVHVAACEAEINEDQLDVLDALIAAPQTTQSRGQIVARYVSDDAPGCAPDYTLSTDSSDQTWWLDAEGDTVLRGKWPVGRATACPPDEPHYHTFRQLLAAMEG